MTELPVQLPQAQAEDRGGNFTSKAIYILSVYKGVIHQALGQGLVMEEGIHRIPSLAV